jgi:thioredoxin 1
MVRISKSAIVTVLLAGIAVLLVLVRTNVLSDHHSNSATESVTNEDTKVDKTVISPHADKKVMKLNVDSFGGTIAEGITLVDFWTPWCGPCRMQGPILEEVARSVAGRAKIAKVNIDDAGSVARQFSVRSIPTLVLFKNGTEVRRFVGVQSHDTLIEAIEELESRS